MSTLRRFARPLRTFVHSSTRRYYRWLEDLIHAVKSELVGRFDGVDQRLAKIEGAVNSSQDALSDQLALQSARIRRLSQSSDVQREELEGLRTDLAASRAELEAARHELGDARTDLTHRLDAAAPSVRLRDLTGARLPDIDGPASGFLNYANSHAGPLADAHLWINHPVVIEWQEGQARVGAVNERIMEQPFVFAAVADLAPGARILDIGGGESTVSFSLASAGYHVTVIEPAGYPFEHPNLSVFEKPLEQFDAVEPFDAVIALSSIEHFGIGHYDFAGPAEADIDAEADVSAMTASANLLGPNGRLALTVPYGPAEVTDVERIYDRAGILQLLEGWTIHRVSIGRRVDDRTWELEANELIEPKEPGRVAMLVATPAAAQ